MLPSSRSVFVYPNSSKIPKFSQASKTTPFEYFERHDKHQFRFMLVMAVVE